MLYSMTGHGRRVLTIDTQRYMVEVKTLNNKNQLECNFRVLPPFRVFELEMRKLFSETLRRGCVDCTITAYAENTEQMGVSDSHFNETLFRKLYTQISPVAHEFSITDTQLFPLVLNLPQVVSQTSGQSLWEDNKWEEVRACLEEVLAQVQDFRMREGSETEKDLRGYVVKIRDLIEKIEQKTPERVEAIRANLKDKLEEARHTEHLASYVSENRLEQELICYIEKLDIGEELKRLATHLRYFLCVMVSKDTNVKGKKLGFIVQEINREVNTIGSKAQNATIQQYVIQVKELLEKIKEQLANVL